jgi:hypothetical protein
MEIQTKNNASIIKILEQHIHCFEVEKSIFETALPIVEAWGGRVINKRLATAIDVALVEAFGNMNNGDKPYPKCGAHVEKNIFGDGYELKFWWHGNDKYTSSQDGWGNRENQYSHTIDASIRFDNQAQLATKLKDRAEGLKEAQYKKALTTSHLTEIQNIIGRIRELHKEADE